MDTTAQYLAQISRAPGTSAVGASAAATAGSQPASKKQKTKDEAARSTLKKYAAEIQTILKDSIIHLNDAFATASCYLDKAIGVNTSKFAVELVKEFRDCTVKARDPLVMLLNKKGKLKGFSRAAGKIFDPMDAATQTTDSATSSSTNDASTDMELTPAHWDSTEVREAKAAAKRRKTMR
ncbi:unnamed protein product [Macrosiphum euphorbiae]|uniref:Uncharacterized protein n=1 Tax=Macrosiphum euphorbiae TaxID=13131 RepID=A0AAV0VPU2_9HEMI|nr:unnamed protein product [Macrosiphum euphorbiae]